MRERIFDFKLIKAVIVVAMKFYTTHIDLMMYTVVVHLFTHSHYLQPLLAICKNSLRAAGSVLKPPPKRQVTVLLPVSSTPRDFTQ